MTTMYTTPPDVLRHPELGELPARRLIECVFALAPNGRILHYHTEQLTAVTEGAATRYTLTDAPPAAERAHCQVIPPMVTAFRRAG